MNNRPTPGPSRSALEALANGAREEARLAMLRANEANAELMREKARHLATTRALEEAYDRRDKLHAVIADQIVQLAKAAGVDRDVVQILAPFVGGWTRTLEDDHDCDAAGCFG